LRGLPAGGAAGGVVIRKLREEESGPRLSRQAESIPP